MLVIVLPSRQAHILTQALTRSACFPWCSKKPSAICHNAPSAYPVSNNLFVFPVVGQPSSSSHPHLEPFSHQGHVYCKLCLKDHANTPGNQGLTSKCPDCRETFHLSTRFRLWRLRLADLGPPHSRAQCMSSHPTISLILLPLL